MAILRRIAVALRWSLTIVGAGAVLLTLWLMRDGPLFLDRLVMERDEPAHAQAIVCLCGGLSSHDLPTAEGWERIYTAVQLQLDGLAPLLIFSGGGDARVSEAEVYAEAARWFGADPATIRLDTLSSTTAEHPLNVLKLDGHPVSRDSSLLIVTSDFHTKRAAMCFRKAGYTNFRMISDYVSSRPDPRVVREARRSESPVFRPNRKFYDDPLNELRGGFGQLMYTLREMLAISVYKFRGFA